MALLVPILFGSCTTHFLRKPEDQIRASLLKRTPVGTSRDSVEAYLEKRGWQNYTAPGQRQPISARLGSYQHGMLYAPTTDVWAKWLIGTNDQVLDIQVTKNTRAAS
jgi:hypothetical protein